MEKSEIGELQSEIREISKRIDSIVNTIDTLDPAKQTDPDTENTEKIE